MNISKIFNANVYVDGTNSLLGRAGEVTLPEVVAKMEEHVGLGMIGVVELPTGLSVLTTKVKWKGFYPDQIEYGANPFVARKLQVRASHETYAAGGRVAELPLVVQLTCRWKKTPLGVFVPQTGQEHEDELATTYVRIVLDGEELLEIDVLENVWRVRGQDVLATYNKNLGG